MRRNEDRDRNTPVITGRHPHYDFRDEIDYDGIRPGENPKGKWGNVDRSTVERNQRRAELTPLFVGLNQAFMTAEVEAKTGVFAMLMWSLGDVSEHDTKRLLYWGKVRF